MGKLDSTFDRFTLLANEVISWNQWLFAYDRFLIPNRRIKKQSLYVSNPSGQQVVFTEHTSQLQQKTFSCFTDKNVLLSLHQCHYCDLFFVVIIVVLLHNKKKNLLNQVSRIVTLFYDGTFPKLYKCRRYFLSACVWIHKICHIKYNVCASISGQMSMYTWFSVIILRFVSIQPDEIAIAKNDEKSAFF